jgi:hypothetical protein
MTEHSPDDGPHSPGMDRDFAVLILNACYRASREMGEVGVMAREFAPGEDGDAIKSQAGWVIAEIGKITETVFKAHPDLEAYVEHQITTFGRVS